MSMLLEEILRKIRAARVKKYISPNAVVLDVGCGQSAFLLNSIKNLIAKGYGFDKKINDFRQDNLEICNSNLEKEIDLPDNTADLVAMLAVLEHLRHPEQILAECYRTLKTGGRMIITTPSPPAKPILEFLAFKLGVLDKKEIGEHLNYFTLNQLKDILIHFGFKIIKAGYFEFGFNLFVVADK